jgi:hypothetical protein
MLKCDEFIGCFGSCQNDISTEIISDFTGEFTVDHEFGGVNKTIKCNAIQGEKIKFTNDFIPGAIHRVLLKKMDGTKIKSLSFKIYNQCL